MKLSKINNVTSAYPVRATKNEQTPKNNNVSHMDRSANLLCDKNYSVLQVKGVNFTGIPAVKPVTEISKKINNLFNIIKSNDMIVAAPDYQKGVSALSEHVDSFNTVIKRVFFVTDSALDRTIGFKKNLSDKMAVNLNEKPLILKDSKNKTAFLKEGEMGILYNHDTVNVGKHEIFINDQEEIMLPIKDSFSMFVDLDEVVEPKIKEINKKSLEKLSVEQQAKPKERKIMFSDVGGMDKTIKELKKNILFPIKYPEMKNGKNMRKSVLLYGPPGTGKSFIAEACANESGAWFKKINASELDDKYVGESEKNWKNLFDEAKKHEPSIIFIDEIDAIARQRGGQDVYGEKTLNTILGLMSDSEKRGDKIYMIAATNKKELIDPAMLRAGRLGLAIEAPAPDLKGTGDILEKYIADEPVAKDFDKPRMVKKLFDNKATGAEIAALAEDARNAALERENILEKMDNGTYVPEDLQKMTLKNEDFDSALEILKNNRTSKERKPIGFVSDLYK